MSDLTTSPIFITGIERSGSSIIARIFKECGAFTGETTEMFENKKIKLMLDKYYVSQNISPKGQYPLPVQNLNLNFTWEPQIQDILKSENYNQGIWMYKSFKLCQTWKMWHFLYPNAKWIIVRRRTGDIISSCLKTRYMDAYYDEKVRNEIGVKTASEGWLWWIRQHEKLFHEMSNTVDYRVVWPERMAYGDFNQIEEVIKWTGLNWNTNIPNKITPLMWNSKQKGVING